MIEYSVASTLLNNCIQNMNFDRIHKAMHAVDWKYYTKSTTPEKEDMIEIIEKLFDSAYECAEKEPVGNVSSGGFEVIVSLLGEDSVVIKFVLDSVYSEEL